MRLRTIGLISTLVLGLLAAPLPAEAQKTGKVYRIGFLDYRLRSTTTDPRLIALRQGLRKLGYVEGQNLVIEYRSAEGKGRAETAAELVRLKVDVIVVSPAPAMIRAAQRATRTIPIVMAGANVDPVEAGFVISFARPGGNITGLTNLTSQLHARRLGLLKEAFPQISRVAMLWSPQQLEQEVKEQALGIQIHRVIAGFLDDLESVFSTISRERPDGLYVQTSPLTLGHRAQIIEFTAKRRLPAIYDNSLFVDAGGLMSYGADSADSYRRAAIYVDKILKGTKPADLPVQRPVWFEFVINLKAADQIGVTFPPEMLFRADKVIK